MNHETHSAVGDQASDLIALIVVVLFGSAILNLGAIVSFIFGDVQ